MAGYRERASSRLLALSLVGALAACGADDPDQPAEDPDNRTSKTASITPPAVDRNSLWPLAVAASWEYDTVWDDDRSLLVIRVADYTDVGTEAYAYEAGKQGTDAKDGVHAYRSVIEGFGLREVYWNEKRGDQILRHRRKRFVHGLLDSDEVYQPHKIVIDETNEQLKVGVDWEHRFTAREWRREAEVEKVQAGAVEALEEQVTVPAGTFTCVRIRLLPAGPGSELGDTYWWARGVGMVKRIHDNGLSMELMRYRIP